MVCIHSIFCSRVSADSGGGE